jgi:hypothetical protein
MRQDSAWITGRHFPRLPGPTAIPERVFAMDRAVIDHCGRELQKRARAFNMSFAAGFGKFARRYFRMRPFVDLNDPTIVGALASLAMTLVSPAAPHRRGGLRAAIDDVGSRAAHRGRRHRVSPAYERSQDATANEQGRNL